MRFCLHKIRHYRLGESSGRFAFPESDKKGQRILKSGIAHMLQNAVYCGLLPWCDEGSIGTHKPLVTTEQFDTVQRIMHGRNKNNSGFGVKDFAYRGLFTCGTCGCMLTAEIKKGKYVYYRCTGNRGSCPKRL